MRALRELRLDDAQVTALGEGRLVVLEDALGPHPDEVARALTDPAALRPAGMGAGASPTRVDALRGDAIAWLDATPEPYARLLEVVAHTLRHDAWLHVAPLETQLARYPVGARYARHLDTFRTGTRTPRRVTLITYLNADWREVDAGALRAWEPDGPREVLPLLGRAVLFLSERVPHEVLPATRERWAVTTWFG